MFGSHAALADVIRADGDGREAARSLRAAFAVVDFDADAAYGHAFRAVERLVVSATGDDELKHWRKLGRRFVDAGAPISSMDLVYLYASCQYGRHVRQDRAKLLLEGRTELSPIECCQVAAGVLRWWALKLSGSPSA